ncbi:alcohol dehydrogenase catalytic domain-containing protein [Microbacterium proteolyticum]|uniref:zinc-dependent alcohol dehydrogenase n=1 Tax=Microbacterium proteolyticum TaxID=1572644 RepID=UPI00241677C2|nr:alcohol dehydrogenase catalytic domain-containing protein [Microbacterium proteolyticum]
MRAAVLYSAGDLRIEDRPVPVPGPGEALVRVTGCGVCGSDATEYSRGPVLTHLPVVLGHEFTGTVEAVGAGVDLPLGAQVVSGAGISCGECKPCRAGRTNLCRRYRTAGLQIDGGLAEFVRVPAATLLDVTAWGLASDTLALAQPMAIAVHAVSRSGLSAGQDAVVLGIGGIGAFITYAAAAVGARVLAVDRSEARLTLARDLGAERTLLAGEQSVADGLTAAGREADVLFEVSGSRAGWDEVVAAALPGAVLVPVGIQREDVPIPLGAWTLREYTIVGTVAHAIGVDLPRAVELLAGRPDWTDVADEVLPLDEVADGALEPLTRGGSRQIKTVIDPTASRRRVARHGVAPARV